MKQSLRQPDSSAGIRPLVLRRPRPPTVVDPPARVPRAAGLPVIGCALDLRRDLLGTLVRAMHEQGDLVRFSAGPPGVRVVMYGCFHPDGVERVLFSESTRYRKDNWTFQEIAGWLGDGILTAQDERWQHLRRLVQPMFTLRRIATYVSVMSEEAERLAERWDRIAAVGGRVDLHLETMRLAMRVVARVLFGADLDRAVPVLHESFPVIGEHILKRTTFPLRLSRTAPTPGNRRAAVAQRALFDICDELIAGRRRHPTGDTDLLSLLLEATDPETGRPLTDGEIRDQLLIFLLAGHETTATSLTFTLHLLGHHHDVQRKVVEEVEEVLDGRTPGSDDVPRLPYTAMVIKEAMRLYPPVFANGRTTAEGDHILGYDLPPGSEIIIAPWAVHRHPALWDEPERFDPQRFTREEEAKRHRYAYFPFGGGPRACLGQHFSSMEAVVTTAILLRAFRIDTPPGPLTLDPALTLRSRSPLYAHLTRRATASASATAS